MNKMLNRYSFTLFILSGLLFSCSNSKASFGANESSTAAGIVIDTFSEFPPEIEGCSCYFSSNKSDFDSGKYIYVDDYGSNAFVSINGEMKSFSLSNSEGETEGHNIKNWISEDFEITLKYKQVGQVEETWQQKGTMKLKSKKGVEVVRDIYGECGC
ncbi:hypothetical protein [Pontibacter pamirensis]|uniref:hypothetical protein n=1 Tax=Pontibacter pamirensis TaxID=2562824 RepID=UPI00138993DE|nr:hypothetical protein [Pontibacter pamirensis]